MHACRPLVLVFLVAVATTLAGCATTSGGRRGGDNLVLGDKAATLDRLYEQFWQEGLELNPLQATFQGDARYNDELPNFLSADYRKRSHAFTTRWLKKVQALGPAGLDGEDLISYEIFVHDAQFALQGEQFPGWMLPVNQFSNLANLAATLGSGNGAQPFRTVQDYDNWHERASGLPAIFDQAIANMREGVAKGVVQPRALMDKVVPQLDALIRDKPEDTLFWMPIKTMPPSFAEADKARITQDYREMIAERLMPAYRRLRDYIANDYMAHTRASVGIGALPGGAAWYAWNARQNTSTSLTPAQIHQEGLDEVARIQDELRKVMQQAKYKGSLQDFFRFMRSDKRFAYKDDGAILARYRDIGARVAAAVPKLFSLLPKARLEIQPVEPYRAASVPAGEYQGPGADGKRPGTFYVNTSDVPSRRTWEAEDLFLHEAIPGHHVQIALQQELAGLPKFRRNGGETAFTEGWGLYAESLGKELGLYQDPYDYAGYLINELWRATRLVVDTGLHAQGWSRERALQYMLDNTAGTPAEANAEIERYLAIPGQALAYKIGQLDIQALRARAEQALGPRFDIRQFHAQVLKDGSLPLDVLDAKIDRWIKVQGAASAPAATTTQTENPDQATSPATATTPEK
jgi:uncharacterized protein (DUF885 family)